MPSGDSNRPSSFVLSLWFIAILLVWSFNYIVAKIALRHIDGFSLAVLRMPLAALLILPIYFSYRNRMPFRIRDLWTFTYLSFFGVIINQGCFTIGLGLTTSDHSVIITALGPISVLLLACALKLEFLTTSKVLGMLICILGVVVLETERGYAVHSPFLAGDLITLASTIGFAICVVLGKRLVREFDPISMYTFLVVASAVLVSPLVVERGIHLDWRSVGWQGWAAMFYIAGFSSVGSYIVFFWLLRHMEASRVAAIDYVQPVVVVLISIPFLGLRPTWNLLAGGALVLLGVYLVERRTRLEIT